MPRLLALLLATALATSACTDSDDEAAPAAASYDSTSQAPSVFEYPEGGEVRPQADRAVVTLSLDSGAEVALWIDPHDMRKVYRQHSDPDDASAWTSPELIHTAGDGCLFIYADTDGTTVGATLGCYDEDAFIQQAPESAVALAAVDLNDWHELAAGELFVEPEVTDGEVVWNESQSWTPDRGFAPL